MKRIAIVGGGPGGLFSALLLYQKSAEKLSLTLYEAASRVGGKLLTRPFDKVPLWYEAGASELYRHKQDRLRLLVEHVLKLPTRKLFDTTAVLLDEKVLRPNDGAERCLRKKTARALKEINRRGLTIRLDGLPLGFKRRGDDRYQWVDRLFRNKGRFSHLYAIEGGMEQLVRSLSEMAPAEHRLGETVERIERTTWGTYRITARQEKTQSVDEFDAVVVALPLECLPAIDWAGLGLGEAMRDHFESLYRPCSVLRVSAVFAQPFWKDLFNETVIIMDAFGGCCLRDRGPRHSVGQYGVLEWTLNGTDAFALSNLADSYIVERMLDSLPQELDWGRKQFIEGRVHRWIGSANRRPNGNRREKVKRRHQPAPRKHPGLVMVGDYMSDGAINGVLDSADTATGLVLKAMGLRSKLLGAEYFDYYGDSSYGKVISDYFDARYVIRFIKRVWGESPPYRLLDAGSANGLTLAAFEKYAVDAWGIENSPYIYARLRSDCSSGTSTVMSANFRSRTIRSTSFTRPASVMSPPNRSIRRSGSFTA